MAFWSVLVLSLAVISLGSAVHRRRSRAAHLVVSVSVPVRELHRDHRQEAEHDGRHLKKLATLLPAAKHRRSTDHDSPPPFHLAILIGLIVNQGH